MKCNDFEQDIYLYSELTAQEKKVVDTHALSCESCRELLASVQQIAPLISQAASVKPQPENFSRLTSTIMQAVAVQQKQSASWINSLVFRYAMVTASLVLIIAFGTELSLPAEGFSKSIPEANTVTLNSASFMKAAIDRKQNPETKSSLYACVKIGDCDNTIIQSFKKKSF